MKKTKMINSELSYTISKMGHTDSLTIGDCGLPIPDEVKRIDLALTHNVPTFIQTLDVVLEELCVEEVVIAEEIENKNIKVYEEILRRFKDIKITKVSHEEFKKLTKDSKAVVRTGECRPLCKYNIKIRSCILMKTPILKMTNIVKEFPGVKALDGVNLELYEGKVMALMGENGAGKSTLMKILSGVYKKDGGQIFYNGVEEDIKGPKDATKKGIAIIHQELNLIKDLSIGENIFLGREFKKGFRVDFNKLHEEGDKLLKKLNVKKSSRELVENLSLGEQQMVEIAKALSLDAKIIIMDEPTDALTETETQSLFKVIEELKSEGKAIVYTSHRLKEIFEVCDYITVLRDGKYVGTEDLANLDEDKMIEMMVGRKLTDQFPRVEITPGKTILKVENLNNEYVSNINFEVRAGEVVGIAGLMGAGRSELAKTIYGHFKRKVVR